MYKVIKSYHLGMYDHDMTKLYDDLKNFLYEKFRDSPLKFEPHERLIFYLRDHDFFINEDVPGFALYNLQLVLKELDIPNFFCAVKSNLPNYDRYTCMVRDLLRPDDVPLRSILAFPVVDYLNKVSKEPDIDIESIQFPFISLSRLRRFHRTVFNARLFEKQLQHKGLVSYHNLVDKTDQHNTSTIVGGDLNLSFLTTAPCFAKLNQQIFLNKQHNRELVETFKSEISFFSNLQDQNNIQDKTFSNSLQNSILNQALVFVALETTVQYPGPFLSNISFKGIADKRPFVILGVPGTLHFLQQLGFKTFDQWWDESYDQEQDLENRIDMIIDILDQLAKLSPAEWQHLCSDMQKILDHNYDHLFRVLPARLQQDEDRILNCDILT